MSRAAVSDCLLWGEDWGIRRSWLRLCVWDQRAMGWALWGVYARKVSHGEEEEWKNRPDSGAGGSRQRRMMAPPPQRPPTLCIADAKRASRGSLAASKGATKRAPTRGPAHACLPASHTHIALLRSVLDARPFGRVLA